MQAEMVTSGMRDRELGDPATARDRLIPDSDLAVLLEEIRIGVENAIWQAYFAWMAGEEPVHSLQPGDASLCNGCPMG